MSILWVFRGRMVGGHCKTGWITHCWANHVMHNSFLKSWGEEGGVEEGKFDDVYIYASVPTCILTINSYNENLYNRVRDHISHISIFADARLKYPKRQFWKYLNLTLNTVMIFPADWILISSDLKIIVGRFTNDITIVSKTIILSPNVIMPRGSVSVVSPKSS